MLGLLPHRPPKSNRPSGLPGVLLLWLALLSPLALFILGCSNHKKPENKVVIKPLYEPLPPRQNLPAFMKGTIFEAVEVQNKEPYPVSGYGLVVGLEKTGNNADTPPTIWNMMVDEMTRKGFGTFNDAFKEFKPERVLRDPQTAIVEVYAMLPPGGRAGQQMDIFVQAVTGSQTKSLARGLLYRADLFLGGVDPLNPRPKVNVFARAEGPVFVNPSYASASATQPASFTGLRTGTIMNGGVVVRDRPIYFRARQPQLSLTRAIEYRLVHKFQDNEVAKTKDEGFVWAFTPLSFKGDWEHFIGVATHLYLDSTPGTGVIKARKLAEEAVKPDAKLMDISYCWEGIGEEAIPAIQPLYVHTSPDVAFAAVRAGVYVGDRNANDMMLAIAKMNEHPFQLNAVKVLGSLPATTQIERMLKELLSAKNALVRIEAYQILARIESPVIWSKHIQRGKFIIDRIETDGAPLVFCSRVGEPRIAVFGNRPSLKTPIFYSAMNSRLTITSPADGKSILIFDRTNDSRPEGIQLKMRPDLYALLDELTGEGKSDAGFRFGYSDLVGILQGLAEGKHMDATFVLQDIPSMQDAIDAAPSIGEQLETEPAPAAQGSRASR